MNSRLTTALAVAGGYVLGRTKKAKFAFGVATMVMGRRLQLGPQALARPATEQLSKNPRFKELGDQLRDDLRGAGKAATGALVNRQVNALADRLHERTLGIRDQLAGGGSGAREEAEGAGADGAEADGADDTTAESPGEDAGQEPESAASPAKKTARGTAAKKAPAKKAPAKKPAAKKTAAKKSAAKRPAAKQSTGRPAAKKTAAGGPAAKRTGARTAAKKTASGTRSGGTKGGRSRG
ncbi:hypothetical protein [Streptomyces albus]|uniref:hypothetical protein n=1 Tax=Streptomyces sp. NRRL F-5917 TaxID=1463873 RepID=UPI0004BEDD8E|nr:hypothetical protein [Streptomyces sp. NRRL F-5917]